MAKAKKKSKAKKKTKKPVKRVAAKSKRSPVKAKKAKKAARPAKKAVKAKVKTPVKKAVPKKKQKVVGEGDYAASRAFDKDQTAFVKRNKAKIPEMGKAAEKALDGPEGDSLRAAEQEAMDRTTV